MLSVFSKLYFPHHIYAFLSVKWKTSLLFSFSTHIKARMLFTYQQMMLGRTLDKSSLETSHNSTSLRKCLIFLECWEKDGGGSFAPKQKSPKMWLQLCGVENIWGRFCAKTKMSKKCLELCGVEISWGQDAHH